MEHAPSALGRLPSASGRVSCADGTFLGTSSTTVVFGDAGDKVLQDVVGGFLVAAGQRILESEFAQETRDVLRAADPVEPAASDAELLHDVPPNESLQMVRDRRAREIEPVCDVEGFHVRVDEETLQDPPHGRAPEDGEEVLVLRRPSVAREKSPLLRPDHPGLDEPMPRQNVEVVFDRAEPEPQLAYDASEMDAGEVVHVLVDPSTRLERKKTPGDPGRIPALPGVRVGGACWR